MSRSLALSLNGNSSIINTNFFPPIEWNGRYECALIDFNMYNSIPNIDEKTRNNSIVEYRDYQIPVTQLKGPKGNGDMLAAVRLKCATYRR